MDKTYFDDLVKLHETQDKLNLIQAGINHEQYKFNKIQYKINYFQDVFNIFVLLLITGLVLFVIFLK